MAAGKKLTAEDVAKVAQAKNPNLRLVESSYVDLSTLCIWVEEGWGEFERKPSIILYSNSVYHPEHGRLRKNAILAKAQQKPESKQKRKTTNLAKYGHEYISLCPHVRSKVCATNLERYGHETPLLNADVQAKISATNLERYGHENPLLNADVQAKIRATNLEAYGVENVLSSSLIQDRVKTTNLQRYGFANAVQAEAVQSKTKNTNLQRYGAEYGLSNPDVQRKRRLTNVARYGSAHATLHPAVRAKLSATNIARYGHQSSFGNSDVQKKIYRTKMLRGLYKQSKGELELRDFCKTLDPDARTTMAYLNKKAFQIDIFLPSKNICIEYNGMFWHSEGNKKNYSEKHLDKTKACALQDRRLIHIWETEWHNKRPQVENYIRSVAGIFERRIPARKCLVKEVTDKAQVKAFLDSNHLLGACPFSKAVGIFLNEELVGVALLGRHHRTNVLNIAKRFAFLAGVQVIGGVSRLTKHLLDVCESDSLVTWADVRLGAASVYTSAGWTLDSTSRPDYFYWHESQKRVVSKQHFKDHRKSSTGVSEKDFAKTRRCLRIWDCGKHRFRIYKGGIPTCSLSSP